MTRLNRVFTLAIFCLAFIMYGCQGAPVKPETSSSALSPYKSPYRPIEGLEPGTIVHVPTGTVLTEDDLYRYLSGSRVIYIGESHRSLNHHRIQLKIIRALAKEHPNSLSVGLEMFKKDSQDKINHWLDNDMDDKEFFKLWMTNWGVNYEYYKEILQFIKKHKIPIIALNATNDTLKAAIHDDKETGKTWDALIEMPTIDESDPYHRATSEAIYQDPNHGKRDFQSFYKVQLIWEETMAETLAKYLENQNGASRTMVVLAGGGHINYGFGIPKRLFRRLSVPYTTILPVSTDILTDEKSAVAKGAKFLAVTMPDVPLYIADVVWATTYETINTNPPKLGVYLVENAGQVAITIVSQGSPAEEYGLMEGDIIVALDDEKINDILDIKYFLKSKQMGTHVKVTVKRGPGNLDITLMLKPLKAAQ